MAKIDTVDSIEITAEAGKVFDVVFDYPSIETWFPTYRCRLIANGSAVIGENSRIEHIIGRPAMSRFIRTIRHVVPGERLDETYDEGSLRGTGTWTFKQQGSITTAAYHCVVEGNSVLMNIGLWLTGAGAHNKVYQRLLGALKARCEGP